MTNIPVFFFNDTATTEIYTLSLHDALPISIEIAPVIHQALDDLGPLPADSKIALAIGDCRLCCPPDVLGRIVENLVSNAIKYRAPERPLELAITAARTGDAIEVAVADNGVGMDAAAMSRA